MALAKAAAMAEAGETAKWRLAAGTADLVVGIFFIAAPGFALWLWPFWIGGY